MIDPDDKENVAYNYSYQKGKVLDYKNEVIDDDDLGCVTLSESEDEPCPDMGAVAVTEEFLNQAEKCLMDIEQFETEEETKMELINLLYHHIQLQRQGATTVAPITYELLKESLAPTKERKDSYEDKELDEELFQPFERDHEEEVHEAEIEAEEMPESYFVCPDEIAIKPKKTFEEILEEELRKEDLARQEEERKELDKVLMPPPAPPVKAAPKKKFLKRGEGIARFNSAPPRKVPGKSKPAMKPETNTAPKRMIGLIKPGNTGNAEKAIGRPNKLPSKIKIDDPITVVPGKDSVRAIRGKPVMSPIRTSPESSPARSPQPSISQRLKDNAVNNPVNSVVSNPVKNVAEISGFLNSAQLEERMAAEEEELEEFRMLEEAAADKSINSLIGMLKFTPSSVIRPPTCATVQESEEEEEEEGEEKEFDDNETWGFRTPVKMKSDECVDLELLGEEHLTPCNEGEIADREPSTNGVTGVSNTQPSKLLSSLFPGLKPPPPPPAPEPEVKKPDPECEALKSELKNKLSELEKEVARFQQEAAGLARARAEKESELRKLRQENDKYVEDMEEREKKFQEFREREMKMIRSEKKQFEMTQLSAKQRAAKLELVDNLTERVQSLEEELTRKEERWNVTFTRLKNKAEAKEQECVELHKQITVLEQEKIALWEKEVIRTSNRRHKHAQTEEQTNKPSIRTQAQSTSCEETVRPDLVSRHPQLATLNAPQHSRVKFAEQGAAAPAAESTAPAAERAVMGANLVASPEWTAHKAGRAAHEGGQENGEAVYVELVDNVTTVSSVPPEETLSSNSPTGSNSTLTNHVTKTGIETIGADGSVTVKYGNGTVKHVSADGRVITMTYFNGDTKKTYHDGRVVYTFLKDGITQTQLPDGTERTLFPTGQEETKFPDNRLEIKYPDKSTKVTYPNGEEKSVYADGTVVTLDKSGQRLILLPNGQREVHTSAFKRREYPDGTSKTVYNDGRQETVHSNGRIRKKDTKGNLVSDVIVDSSGKIVHDYLAKGRI